MNKLKMLAWSATAVVLAPLAQAAEFADTGEAITAVGGYLTTGQTKFLVALGVGVGVFGATIIIRLIRKGLSVA